MEPIELRTALEIRVWRETIAASLSRATLEVSLTQADRAVVALRERLIRGRAANEAALSDRIPGERLQAV